MALTKTPIELSSTPGIVDNSNDTAITIDASENVLVGVTSTTIPGIGNTTSGVSIRGDDGSFFSRALGSGDANNVVSVNRSTADGNILGFQKDGTTVGSIGTNAATMYVSAPQAGGMKYSYLTSTNAVMLPVTTTGASSDGTHDLGLAGGRFRDIYLSGGVNFSVNANAAGMTSELLDDYEEGTWTPTDASGEGYSLTVNSASYTKIGRLVYITVYIDYPAQSSSAAQLNGGLPFPSMSGTTYPQLTARVIDDTVSAQNLTFQITTNSTEGGVLDGLARITNAELSGKGVLYTGCYQTA